MLYHHIALAKHSIPVSVIATSLFVLTVTLARGGGVVGANPRTDDFQSPFFDSTRL